MHHICGGVVNIAFDLTGDLRPVFADAPAMEQHAFGYVAGLLYKPSIMGHDVTEANSRLHELYQRVEDFHADVESVFQFSWNLAKASRLHGLRDVAAVFRFELGVDQIAGLEPTMGCDARSPWDFNTRTPVGHGRIVAAVGNDRIPDGCHHFVLHDTGLRFREDGFYDLVEDLSSTFYPCDFFRPLDRARILKHFRRILEFGLWEIFS